MKLILSTLFSLVMLVGYSYPKLETFEVSERIFYTYFNGMEGQVFLGVSSFSDCSSYIYTVEGWYDLGGDKKRLVGLCRNRELYLYHFEEDYLADKMVFEFYNGGFSWREIDKIINISNYSEKISASHNGNSFEWTWEKGAYSMVLNTFWVQGTSVFEKYTFLILNEDNRINLENIVNLIRPSFKIIGVCKNTKKILLSYSAMPRANACGQCGAGDYDGFIQLDFDEKERLTNVNQVILRSCDDGLYGGETKRSKNKVIYEVQSEDDSTQYKIEIDLKEAVLTKVNL